MAADKPTPEEKLFAVIQGAQMPPVRGRASAPSIAAVRQRLAALVSSIDLPRLNQALMVVMALLGVGMIGQLFTLPSVERLMATSDALPSFQIAPPLEGLKPLEAYLPRVLEADPFRVGSTPTGASIAQSSLVAAAPDAQALTASMRLVGIAWGDAPTAMIEQDKQTYVLKTGDLIGSLTVKEILRDRVILKAGDQEIELF